MDVEKNNEPRKILLVNLHSAWNAGDEALTHEALRQLKEQFPQASLTLAMNDPDSHRGEGKAIGSFTTWVKPIRDDRSSPWRWQAFPDLFGKGLLALVGYWLTGQPWLFGLSKEQQALLKAYFQADMVISCAGNFLYTSGRLGFPFLLSLLSILYGWFAGKALYTLPQTLGPIRRGWECLLAKLVLSKMRLVLVRDPISIRVWRAWNIQGTRCELIPDLAFAFNVEEGKKEAQDLLAEHGIQGDDHRPYLGVTLIHWSAQNQRFSRQALYEKAISDAIRAFLNSYGGRAILFSQVHGPTMAEDDRVPARRILAQLDDLRDQVVMIERWVPSYVLKAAYGHMDLFLGTRLHSNIFALAEGVPVVAISYQYKTQGILRMLGLEQWTLDIEEINTETLIKLIHKTWVEREQTRSYIKAILPELQVQASRAGELIASDFVDLHLKA